MWDQARTSLRKLPSSELKDDKRGWQGSEGFVDSSMIYK